MAIDEFKVEVVSNRTIHPSSYGFGDQTFRISLLDQLSPAMYSPVLLFYPRRGGGGEEDGGESDATVRGKLQVSDKSRRLQSTLADVLAQFYPLAGRIRENFYIDFSHKEGGEGEGEGGVSYKEAKVNCLLKDVLEKPDIAAHRKLLPVDMESVEAATGFLLMVQASFFECGGLVVGVCVSHKIADAATLGAFIRAWAGLARDDSSSGEAVAPSFAISSAFPARDDLKSLPVTALSKGRNCFTRRYVFDSAKVEALKDKSSSAAVPRPTRVEVVSALLWKCASNASRRRTGATSSSHTVMSQAVDLRRRLVNPLPENSMGNLVGAFMARDSDPETNLADLVGKLRESMKTYLENYPKRLQLQGEELAKTIFEAAGQFGDVMNRQDVDFYNCSSWCKLRFYEADFGWGKPVWVGLGSTEFKNSIVLVDSRDGKGIEVWLTLTEPDMAELDHDQELLEFATLNPTISW